MESAIPTKERGELSLSSRWGQPLSSRAYLGLMGLFTFAGLAVMALETALLYNPVAMAWLDAHPMGYLAISLGTLATSIVGIVLQVMGRDRHGSMSMTMMGVGYGLLVASLGLAVSCILINYDLGSVLPAFVSAAVLSVGMTALGFAFPRFFERISGVLFALLIGVLVAEVILMFTGIHQTWIDWLVLAIFSGFMARDTYCAAHDVPSAANALFWASSIYIDFVNIFLSILQLMNRD